MCNSNRLVMKKQRIATIGFVVAEAEFCQEAFISWQGLNRAVTAYIYLSLGLLRSGRLREDSRAS